VQCDNDLWGGQVEDFVATITTIPGVIRDIHLLQVRPAGTVKNQQCMISERHYFKSSVIWKIKELLSCTVYAVQLLLSSGTNGEPC
jgi:hypothetical protein